MMPTSMPRRLRLLCPVLCFAAALTALGCAAAGTQANAQDWPVRPVTMVVPFAAGGTGTSSHVSCVMLNQIMGVNTTHVPYRGGGPAFQDVIAGRIDYICNYISIGAAAVKSEQVKALATLARERTALLPDLPTADQQGVKDFDVSAWDANLLAQIGTAAM